MCYRLKVFFVAVVALAVAYPQGGGGGGSGGSGGGEGGYGGGSGFITPVDIKKETEIHFKVSNR